MIKKYLMLSLFLLAGCTKGTSAEDYMVDLKEIVIETPLEIASRFLNFSERTHRTQLKEFIGVDPLRIDWCAAFVNAVLKELDLPGSDSVSDYPLVARSFLKWGKRVKEPQPGDIVVFPRGREPWQGHVGFYVDTVYENGTKFYQVISGNHKDSVTMELFPARSALGIRRYPK